ncbi:MAG: fumarate reductase/succinate dehydrogenase flavoprotein subunit, partial [Bacteroidales bacterium]|nr:fumarate reductase/succinate dehydrogenase flavoprotein subunit [Bacteroidales bacterium]
CSGDGYFIIPYTITNYLADEIRTPRISTEKPEFKESEEAMREKIDRLLAINGTQTATSFHKRLGKILWDYSGMARNEEGLNKAMDMIEELRKEFWNDVKIPGSANELNQELEKAGRVADFFELAKLLVTDALHRKESCGAHFREESQTDTGEAKRDDTNYSFVSAWEYQGEGLPPKLHKEELTFEFVEVKERSYK